MKKVGYEKENNALNERTIEKKRFTDSVKGQVIIFGVLMTIIIASYACIKRHIDEVNYEKKLNAGYCSGNEYVRTIDCAPIIDEYGVDKKYKIEFELKTELPGNVTVYFQNGTTAKYNFRKIISATTEFQKYVLEIEVELFDANETEAYLSVYGGYETGVIPTIRYIKFEVVN